MIISALYIGCTPYNPTTATKEFYNIKTQFALFFNENRANILCENYANFMR
jgi:hypothetical protein